MEHNTNGAIASVHGSALAPGLSGIVRFYDTPDGVRVDARVGGLPKNATGFYGFHLHEAGEFRWKRSIWPRTQRDISQGDDAGR